MPTATRSKQETTSTKDIVRWAAEELDLSQKDCEGVIQYFLDVITDEVSNGNKVQLHGFGQFYPHQTSARTGRNPRTGETVKIKAKTTPKFKAATAFREAVR